jgi:hypothetical protein
MSAIGAKPTFRLSDGFPHYVHFLAEKLFWRVFRADNGGVITGELFEGAMADASGSMEMKLRGPYDTATQKYTNEYAWVLSSPPSWAAAFRDIHSQDQQGFFALQFHVPDRASAIDVGEENTRNHDEVDHHGRHKPGAH